MKVGWGAILREGVLFRKRGSVVPNPNPELEPPRPLLMLPLICQHQWAGRLIMGKGGGTQSKESDGELLCSRVSEFLPPSPPLVNTWWKYFLLIWGRYGGQQWGEGVEMSCKGVGGCGGLLGMVGQAAATPVRDCPCLGRLLRGSQRWLLVTIHHNKSCHFACRRFFGRWSTFEMKTSRLVQNIRLPYYGI